MRNRTGDPTGQPGEDWAARLTGRTAQAALDIAVSGSRPDVLAAMASSAGWAPVDLDPLLLAGLVVVDADRDLTFPTDDARALVLAAAPPMAVCEAHRRAAAACRSLRLPVRDLVDHLVASTLLADEATARALEEAAIEAEAQDDLRAASDAWQAAARLSPVASDRVSRAVSGLRLVVVNGLDYAGVEVLLDLLAGEQLSSECACWVEWVQALQRSEVHPESAVTAQWTTIRRAKDAAPGTLRALVWDAAMNAWTLGDAAGGLRAARAYAELESEGTGEGVEPPWAGAALMSAALFEVGDAGEAARLRRRAMEEARHVEPEALRFDRLLSIVFLDDLILDLSAEAGNRLLVCMERTSEESATFACLLGIEAWRARARSDLAGAEVLLARGRPLAAATGAAGAQRGMAALALEIAAIRGTDGVLATEVGPFREHARRKGDRRRLTTVDRAVGLRSLAGGRLEEAVVSLSAAADVPFLARGLRDGVLPARVDLVEAVARLGDADRAQRRAAAVMEILTAMDEPLAAALACRVAGLTSSGARAVDLFHEAVAHHRQAGETFECARTLLLLGEEERRDRRRSDARLHLLEAAAVFEALRAAPWLARTRGELRAAGGLLEAPVGPNPLTAQELAVARRAAAGLTTREVAEALVLSPRTVEFHLGNVYRKLGIHGRGGLATRLASLSEQSPVEAELTG